MAEVLLLSFGAGLYLDAEVYNKGCMRSVSLTSLIKPPGAKAPHCPRHCSHSPVKREAVDAGSNKRHNLPPSAIILNSIIYLKKGNGVPCPPCVLSHLLRSNPTL